MAFSDSLKKITAWGRNNQRSLIVIGVIAAISTSVLIFSPGGWGIWKEESVVTRTIETIGKDKQGNVIKTVETTKIDSGKTFWDWLSLLGVPLTLVILGFLLQQKQQKRAEQLAKEQRDRDLEIARQQRERDEEMAKQQRERDEEIAKQQRELGEEIAKEEALQSYLDRLSVLLVDKNLRAIAAKINTNNPEAPQATAEEKELLNSAVDVIRARTLSILRRFEVDKERKTSVIRFLLKADIVNKLKLNLSRVDLSGADLSLANLKYANLEYANLEYANLHGTVLDRANLRFANLRSADLRNIQLCGAALISTNLCDANLFGANLICADLRNADLRNTNLCEANLNYIDLQGIKWDSKTLWPDKQTFANVKNIPDELRKQLDLPEQNP